MTEFEIEVLAQLDRIATALEPLPIVSHAATPPPPAGDLETARQLLERMRTDLQETLKNAGQQPS